jgi:hypothetical protein
MRTWSAKLFLKNLESKAEKVKSRGLLYYLLICIVGLIFCGVAFLLIVSLSQTDADKKRIRDLFLRIDKCVEDKLRKSDVVNRNSDEIDKIKEQCSSE